MERRSPRQSATKCESRCWPTAEIARSSCSGQAERLIGCFNTIELKDESMLTRLSEKVWQPNQADARRLCENGSEAWIREGFKAVVCPAFNVRIPYHPRIAALLLPVWDDTDAPGTMYETAARFHRDFGPTLVHCNGGLNRSSAFAAALLITD